MQSRYAASRYAVQNQTTLNEQRRSLSPVLFVQPTRHVVVRRRVTSPVNDASRRRPVQSFMLKFLVLNFMLVYLLSVSRGRSQNIVYKCVGMTPSILKLLSSVIN